MSETVRINNIEIKQENCLDETFFNKPCVGLANDLLGKYLVRKLASGELLVGRIVETESYCGVEDRASHSYNNRRTVRNEPMFMKHGTIYVYFTYGMYYCFNISSKGPGSAVLIRSLEPVHNLDLMLRLRDTFNANRNKKEVKQARSSESPMCTKKEANEDQRKCRSNVSISKPTRRKSLIKEHQLCNGPSKLCISMDITIDSMNKQHICESEDLWVQDLSDSKFKVVKSSRIGIGDHAKEWKNKLLRFYILDNKCVSKIDKAMESNL
ncbi:hypothetical protein WDU94_001360 [Cyamophila willieti]